MRTVRVNQEIVLVVTVQVRGREAIDRPQALDLEATTRAERVTARLAVVVEDTAEDEVDVAMTVDEAAHEEDVEDLREKMVALRNRRAKLLPLRRPLLQLHLLARNHEQGKSEHFPVILLFCTE